VLLKFPKGFVFLTETIVLDAETDNSGKELASHVRVGVDRKRHRGWTVADDVIRASEVVSGDATIWAGVHVDSSPSP
jgi:hypothetical protein